MDKGKGKEKEGDEEIRSEEHEAESIFGGGGIEACLKDLESQLTIDPAKQIPSH